jgi:excisionase family DNA binding protein
MNRKTRERSSALEDLGQLQLLSVDSAAELLSVSPKTVRRMLTRGTLPHCRLGRLVRIQRADLERYIASSAAC